MKHKLEDGKQKHIFELFLNEWLRATSAPSKFVIIYLKHYK